MKFKNKTAEIRKKIGREAANVLNITKKEKRRIQSVLTFNIFFQSIMTAIYASGVSETKTLIKEPVSVVTGCVSALGALMILISIVQYMVSEDPQAGSIAKKRIKIVIISWVAILCTMILADIIISFAKVGIDDLYNGTIS